MPSPFGRSATGGVLAIGLFFFAATYAAAVSGFCGCAACLSGGACPASQSWAGGLPAGGWLSPTEEDAEVPFAEFRVGARWSSTAGSGRSTGGRGGPVTLTWGFVADGVQVASGGNNIPSDLRAELNTQFGASPTGDIRQAPWFRLFEASFNRWSELSGVTYQYEANDTGEALDGTPAPSGRRGFTPDVRIGGRSVDGSTGSNTLAFNYFPQHGDMVIDTDNSFRSSANDFRFFRNTIMHEAGHGLGFNHVESNNSNQLMEPFISTAFDGPQLDDILAVQRNYGDAREKNGGNDTFTLAGFAGNFGADDAWVVGADVRRSIDANGRSVIARTMTDFVSIDGDNDVDYFGFTVSEPVFADVALSQVGATYNEAAQAPSGSDPFPQNPLTSASLNNLRLTVQRLEGSNLVEVGVGAFSSLVAQAVRGALLLPGERYFARVDALPTDARDNVQLYELALNFVAAPVPEPAAVALAATVAAAGAARRRRAA